MRSKFNTCSPLPPIFHDTGRDLSTGLRLGLLHCIKTSEWDLLPHCSYQPTFTFGVPSSGRNRPIGLALLARVLGINHQVVLYEMCLST